MYAPNNVPLLAPGPLVALLETVSSDRRAFERWLPSSEATHLLVNFEQRLSKAIDAGSLADSWVSIEQLANLTNRPASTLRRICKNYGPRVGAYKSAGAWTIDWRAFEKAWKSGTVNQLESAA